MKFMCYNTHRIAGRLAKVNQKEVTRSVNKRTTAFLLGSVLLCHASLVYGEVPDYNTVVEDTQKENKAVQMFETDDGKGNTVQVAAHQETLYVTARKTGIYTMPSDSSAELAAVSLGDQVEQTAICDNGWSKVEAEADGEKVIGYIQTQALNSENQIVSMDAEEVEVTSDSSILDYPGKQDGEVVGEVLELDEVKRTGTVNNVWSRIEYQNADGTEQEGYIRDSFEPLQAFGEHAAMMHYAPSKETDVVLKEGGMLLSDTGGGYYEGSTDITRTTVLGHITPELKKYYTAVYRAMQHLSAANFLYGNHGWSLDVLARQPIWDMNKDFQCGTGHGFGYLGSIHEPPTGFRWYIVPSKNEHHQFEPGMVITDEPGIYEEGDFGIRIENNLLTVNGEKNKYGQFMHFETLNFVPIDLDGIDPEELTRSEKEWLNDYHKACYEKVGPYLTDEEREWLKEYTRAI